MTEVASVSVRLRRLLESAQQVRDSITRSAGETVTYRDVLDILDLVRELATIVSQESRETTQAISGLAEYHN